MATQPHIPYSILSQDQHETMQPNGQFVKVMSITFKGPSGVVASVDVPMDNYSATVVDMYIQNDLRDIEAVSGLGSSPATPDAQAAAVAGP